MFCLRALRAYFFLHVSPDCAFPGGCTLHDEIDRNWNFSHEFFLSRSILQIIQSAEANAEIEQRDREMNLFFSNPRYKRSRGANGKFAKGLASSNDAQSQSSDDSPASSRPATPLQHAPPSTFFTFTL